MASTTILISSIMGAVVLIVIIIVIVKCCDCVSLLKIFNSSTKRTTSEQDYTRGQDAAIEMEPLEQFINDILREKPMRYTSDQIMSITDNFSTELGKGGFGIVYKGKFSDRFEVAVKVLKVAMNRRAEEQFVAEIATVGRTYHMNLVKLYGFCFDKNMKALIYEYIENGSLDKYLFEENKKLDQQVLYEIAVGTAKGIRYLHEECEQKIVHYDIKPANVLLADDFVPKVADFGLARYCKRLSISNKSNSSSSSSKHSNSNMSSSGYAGEILTTGRGTPGYAAPELWTGQPVTHKCDVYSFGMLLFEILARRRNLDLEMSDESQVWFPKWAWQKFEQGQLETILEQCEMRDDKDMKDKAERMCKVALWCVQYQPENRPTMNGVVRMLEGDTEIILPVNPFVYLMASGSENSTPWSVSLSTTARGYTTSKDSMEISMEIREDSEIDSSEERSMVAKNVE